MRLYTCTFFVLLCVIYRLTGHAGDQLQRAENSERPEGRKQAGENNGGGADTCRSFPTMTTDYIEVAELPEGGKIYAAPLSAILRHHIREEPERIV